MAALNQPPDPLHGLPLPEDIGDETLAVLADFLHDLASLIENHYFGQLQRHYATHDRPPTDPAPDPEPIPDPPF